MKRTPKDVLVNRLLQHPVLNLDDRQIDILTTNILDDLNKAGFEITPDEVGNEEVSVDISRARTTVPWFTGCNLCDSFKKDADDHAGLITWVGAVGRHFEQHHDILLIQDPNVPDSTP